MGVCSPLCQKTNRNNEKILEDENACFTISDESQNSYNVRIPMDKNVLDLKSILADNAKLKISHIKLFYKSAEIRDLETIKNIKGIKEIHMMRCNTQAFRNSKIFLEPPVNIKQIPNIVVLDESKILEINIKTTSKQFFTLRMKDDSLIDDIRKEAATKLNLNKEDLILSIRGNQLANSRNISFYHPENPVTILILIPDKEDLINVVVEYQNSKEKMEIAKTVEIELVKDKIALKYKLDIDNFNLEYNGNILEKSTRVGKYKIINEGILKVIPNEN